MSKLRLFFSAILVCALAAGNVQAQTFTLNTDTTKGWWATAGSTVDLKIKVTSTSGSPINFDWKVSSLSLASKWHVTSICDPNNCYSETKPGLLDGSSLFSTSSPVTSGYFLLDFDADSAAFGTSSTAVLEITSGSTTSKATYIGYKNTTGVVTYTRADDNISIFPNPAQSYIDVLYSPNSDVNTIAIYNIIGKVISVYKVTDKSSARCEFNADMPSGIYLVRIADSKGNVIATRKITRQ